MKTWSMADGDEIVVDGGKCCITSGGVAEFILLFGKWSEIEGANKVHRQLIGRSFKIKRGGRPKRFVRVQGSREK